MELRTGFLVREWTGLDGKPQDDEEGFDPDLMNSLQEGESGGSQPL